ncbi:phage terminase large subunit family protein [Cytobacillus sp. IB215665]|uniref:phage terminase large subunit family protein n=1 Tax=Cytobacillus sp. IB215665 TaxID=3097357 RepID=UPI002A13051F|nr:phage terminase large subunit family protein [Cytobacillus sp. IB215665]MDX8367771.1 phage terminase large subunit family protein [Cytobacillus sp. IB215665]
MMDKNVVKLFRNIAKQFAPPPTLTVSEWADKYRKLSPEASAEPGQWRTDRAPYQREIMDAVNSSEYETVVIMSSAQVGKTELLLNVTGYFIDYDPAPMMLVQPTDKMAEAFSKDRLAPMLRDSPTLKGKVKDVKSRDSGNTLLHKKFAGGHITLAGANSPASLASRPIRIVLLDEVDRFPLSAGSEGDPVSLVSKRTNTFWNRKKILVSTPTIKGVSRIESAYEDSTMEQWHLPCPNCEEYQPLTWGKIKFDQQPITMECEDCGFRFTEQEWKAGKGRWVARKTNVKARGFHLNELSSPWKRWEEVVNDFKEAREVQKKGDNERMKVWVNTSLGETWEEDGEQLDENSLIDKREVYKVDVPLGVKVLTAAVDVQGDRLECEVVGWGAGKESWGIEYRRFYGDPSEPEVWNELDDYLDRTWKREDALDLKVSCTAIDSGGHHTTEVYRFCKAREHRRIFAIKGQGGQGVPLIGRMSRTKREKCALFIVGVDSGKELVVSRLKKEFQGPGFCHFPSQADKGYDEEYFRGLTSEKKVIRYHKGRPRFEWVKVGSVRNEPLDLRNYATAALEILNPDLDKEQLVRKKRVKRKRGVLSKGVQ